MSSYNANIPLPTDNISDSQQDLLNNFAQLDTSFGIDHYTFSNATPDNGKHNQVTTPIISGSAHPTTSASEAKMYAMEDIPAVGLLQYSRGPSNAIPTPITKLQAPSAITLLPAGTTNILNFSGMTRCIGTLYFGSMTAAIDLGDTFTQTFLWTGSALRIQNQISVATTFNLVVSGTTLQLANITGVTVNNVYWTLELHRMQ